MGPQGLPGIPGLDGCNGTDVSTICLFYFDNIKSSKYLFYNF